MSFCVFLLLLPQALILVGHPALLFTSAVTTTMQITS